MKLRNKVLVAFGVLFALMFVLRIMYGYTVYPQGVEQVYNQQLSLDGDGLRNYASSKFEKGKGGGQTVQTSEQKYEKIANVSSKTAEFEKDLEKAKKLIQDNNAVIQFEKRNGNPGQRELNLVIGVHPDKFDSFYEQIQKIGIVLSRNVSKTDKTNDFLKLNAQKVSLEKSRAALIELKNKGGRIEEYIQLQEKILNIEKELQDLGVSLGSFDEVNQFCTVKFNLSEGKKNSISVIRRVVVAFGWTVKYYLGIVFAVLFVLASTSLIVWLYDRFQVGAVLEKIVFGKKIKSGKVKRK